MRLNTQRAKHRFKDWCEKGWASSPVNPCNVDRFKGAFGSSYGYARPSQRTDLTVKDFILLMHADTILPERDADWELYIGQLIGLGCFQGGSSIGQGQAFRKEGDGAPLTRQLTGYIKIQAESLDAASAALKGGLTYEAGGTVEIRELV
jgi:hypothetical protein